VTAPIPCDGRPATCQCENHWGVSRATQWSDHARKFADAVALHLTAQGFEAVGQWITWPLNEETRKDYGIYPSREEAMRAMKSNVDFYLYFQIPPDGLTPKEAAIGIQWHRALYDANSRPSQLGGNELIMPLGNEQIAAQMKAIQRIARMN
jgi:hypothetical protein